MSSRRESRERTLQALYAFEVGGQDAVDVTNELIRERIDGDPEARSFAVKLFLRTLDTADEADAIVEKYTKNWELSRIALIDRILLRMAICELMYFEDIPPKVSINEVIEIAKRFSTDRSGQFINGILDAVLVDLRKEGRLRKSGRGLVGMDATGQKSSGNTKSD
jgi:N utilization substance protein B